MKPFSLLLILAFLSTFSHTTQSSQPRLSTSDLSRLLHQLIISALYHDRLASAWIGTYEGIFLFDGMSERHLSYEQRFRSSRLIDRRITALAASEPRLAAGFYRGGLQEIDEFSFLDSDFGRGSKKTGLEYSTIYGFLFYSESNLWVSTQNRIVKLDPQGQVLKNFTIADGLQGSDVTLGASFKSNEGLIYVDGVKEYNRFHPGKIDIDDSPSPMRLTGISLPRESDPIFGGLLELHSLELTHNDHFVTFQFSVLDFIDAERNQFRNMLENYDGQWVENANRNTAPYTRLPAGDYILHVQQMNSAGIWNLQALKRDVSVLPTPWRTWWAYFFYAVALSAVLWGLRRIYRSYSIERQSKHQEKEAFEAENRADEDIQEQLELQDEIVQASYDHSLMTLSLVSDCINYRSENQTEAVKRGLSASSIRRISALSNLEKCISFHAGGAFANLQKYTDGIFPALFKCTSLPPESIVTINDVTPMAIPAELASPISIILYELLENCFQHAFEIGSPANYVHVTLIPKTTYEPVAHFFELTVHDSGVGVVETIEELAGGGSGITIVQSIVSRLDGTFDLTIKNGTSMVIVIPNNT